MNLTIEITRRGTYESSPGTLDAYVIQEKARGPQILQRRLKHLDDAKFAIRQKLPDHILTFVDPPPEPQPTKAITTPRDEYGMKGMKGYRNNAG